MQDRLFCQGRRLTSAWWLVFAMLSDGVQGILHIMRDNGIKEGHRPVSGVRVQGSLTVHTPEEWAGNFKFARHESACSWHKTSHTIVCCCCVPFLHEIYMAGN